MGKQSGYATEILFERNLDTVYQSLQRQARYLQIVNELALALLRTSTMDEVLWLVAKSAIAELGFEDCVIYLRDESGRNLVQRAAHGPKNPIEKEILDPIVIPMGQGIVGTVADTGVSEIVYDTRLDPRYILDDQMRLSEIAVPIIHDNEVIGVIDSEHPDVGYYTESHKEILTTIASIASTRIATALTLERLRETVNALKATQEELQHSEERYRTLYNANPSMFFTLSERGVIRNVNAFAAAQLGYEVDDFIGRSIADLHFDNETAVILKRLKKCLENPGSTERWDSCLITKSGERVWVRESASAIEVENGGHEILVVSEDVSDVHKLSQELRYHASHDALTGLRNRREFEGHLQNALAVARNEGAEHVLLLLDLDMFKVVNDSCGHLAGDELLRQISQIFLSKIRRSDIVARVGGDEFAVLMQFCSLPDALNTAESMREAVEAYRFHWGDRLFSIGVSVGVKRIDGKSEDIGIVLSMADTACYMAKELGRNRIHVYSEADEQVAARTRDIEWIKRLQSALDDNRFKLLQQPIVPVNRPYGTVVHCELLLRMIDIDNTFIQPSTFLSAAERYGMSLRVDRFVVSRALEWLAERQLNTRPLLCSINISGFSLGDEFFEHIMSELKRTGAPVNAVCIEITETAAVANFSNAQRFIKKLRSIGCKFALDDFGSGLSSFAYLKHLPVDFLKIDGSYIRDMLDDPVNLALVTAMNEIAHKMGMQTIAEYVESEAILHKLIDLGIDYAQGYYIAKPDALAEINKQLLPPN